MHPIAAVQSEYSLWTRNPEIAVLEECRKLGVTLVAFSPLGRGFLAGRLQPLTELLDGDIRRTMPRFQSPNFEENLRLTGAARRDRRRGGLHAARSWRWPGCSPGTRTRWSFRAPRGRLTWSKTVVRTRFVSMLQRFGASMRCCLRGRPQGPGIRLRRRSKMTPKNLVKALESYRLARL